MIKLAILLFSFSVINSQEQNEIIQQNNIQEEIINPTSVNDSLQIEGVPDSLNQIKTLPEVRKLDTELKKLEPGEDFFEFKSSLDILKQQVDSLKKVLSTYEEGKGSLPTLDEELLNLIKIPQLRHRIELQNGTIVNGEIIEENDLGIIIQTTIGQLAIEKDKIVNIKEDLPPLAKVELIDEPFVDVYPNKEEITGSIKNIGTKRADFVRVIANLWSPETNLIKRDSVFISGKNVKYYSGIKSDATLEPGSSTKFKIVLTLDEKSDVAYRTYEVKWESFK